MLGRLRRVPPVANNWPRLSNAMRSFRDRMRMDSFDIGF
jgi:hypothetical protein